MNAKIRVWTCHNCGHEVAIPDDGSIGELLFTWLGERTSQVACPACKSRTIQRAHDDTFTRGDFLVINTKNTVRGK